jgi:hypothetical protein
MASGGSEPGYFKELLPDGSVPAGPDGVPVLGNYQGSYDAMNVRNPQPGYRYAHLTRSAGRLSSKARKGYRAVLPGDPEYLGDNLPQHVQQALGEQAVVGDSVLCRVSLEDYEKEMREKDARRRAQLGAEDEFTRKGTVGEAAYARPGRPVRYSLSDHGSYVAAESSEQGAEE